MKILSNYFPKTLYILRGYLHKLPILIILFLYLSVLDVIGIGLIAPYIALVVTPEFVMKSEVYNILLEFGLFSNVKDAILLLSIALILLFSVKAISGVLVNKKILLFCVGHGAMLRSTLMSKYQNMPYELYISRNSSEYIYQIQELAAKFSHTTLQSILKVVSNGMVFISVMVFLAFSDPLALSILLILIIGMVVTFDLFFKRKLHNYGQLSNNLSVEMIKGVREGIEGLKEIRILGKNQYFYDIVKRNAIGYSQANVKASVISSIPKYIMELLIILFIVLLVMSYFILDKDMTLLISTLGVFGVASVRLVPLGNQIMNSLTLIRFHGDSVGILFSDLKELQENNESIASQSSKNNSLLFGDKFQSISLSKVSYKYPGTDKNILNDISLSIKFGESIGVIGPSGSGKTTLIDTLLGLLDPSSGSTAINNKTMSVNNPQWRKHVAYLPQQIFLIDNTMRKNIALGVEESEIDDAKVMKAIHQVQLTDVVSQLPNGLDTILGERGVRLSGGQRQRVALARAFYHDRDVLIMDESTSALDSETENEIVKEMQQFKGKKTIVVIAHRLTTLKHCDRIYRLDNGRIVDVGSYEKIIEGVNS